MVDPIAAFVEIGRVRVLRSLLQPPSGASNSPAQARRFRMKMYASSSSIRNQRGDTGVFFSLQQKRRRRRRRGSGSKNVLSLFLNLLLRPPPTSPSLALFFFLIDSVHLCLSPSLAHALSLSHALSLPQKEFKKHILFLIWTCVKRKNSLSLKKKEKSFSFFLYLPATFLAAATTASLVIPNLA